MLPLKFDGWNLFIWRHLEISSDLLLRSVLLSAFIISSFSFRQRLHRLDSLLYGCAFLIIDKMMENGLFFLFNCQTCFESSGVLMLFVVERLVVTVISLLESCFQLGLYNLLFGCFRLP